MKKRKNPTAAELRRQAEERLKAQKRPSQSDVDTQKLIHELQVHQIELELQNEELSLARTEVEAGLARYTDLYDFAPVGYFTFTRDGTISQSNLAGARLLDVERARLVNRRFELFVFEADRPDFHAFLERVFESKTEEFCEVVLCKEKASPLWAHIKATASGDRQTCRIAVLDISERKRARTLQKAHDELEQRVRERTAQLEMANKEMETFCYSISHDFRAPLRSIEGFSQIILEEAGSQMDEAHSKPPRAYTSRSP